MESVNQSVIGYVHGFCTGILETVSVFICYVTHQSFVALSHHPAPSHILHIEIVSKGYCTKIDLSVHFACSLRCC